MSKIKNFFSIACRLLNEDGVGNLVPCVGVHLELAISGRPEWALLGHETTQSGTARSTIGPQDKRVGGWVVLALHEPVEEGSVSLDASKRWIELDVAGEHFEAWKVGRKPRKGRDLGLKGFGGVLHIGCGGSDSKDCS